MEHRIVAYESRSGRLETLSVGNPFPPDSEACKISIMGRVRILESGGGGRAMLRLTTIGLLVIQGGVTSLALAQQSGVPNPLDSIPQVGYKVAFCYERSRPSQSFRYQVYDLSKRQFDQEAIQRWLELIRSQFPGHTAYVKDITTVRRPGQDEQAALMAAIAQEKEVIVGTHRQSVRSDDSRPTDFGRLMHPSISGYHPARSLGRSSMGRSFGGRSSFGPLPSSNTSPFPNPYPRPHP